MSDITKPGKRLLSKITQRPNLMKVILTFNPEYTDTLDWTEDEKKAFSAAKLSSRLSDKLFALWLLARKLEGHKDFEMPKIFLPEGVKS